MIRDRVVRVVHRSPYSGQTQTGHVQVNVSRPRVTRILHGYETKTMLPPKTREFAERLLAHEGAAGKTTEPVEFPAFRVCETLRRPVSALLGVAGFRPLLSRALALAKAEAPNLSAVEVAPDGSLQCLGELGLQIDQDQYREGGVILIAHLLGVLFLVIGETVTSRLVTSQVLPHRGFLPKSGVSTDSEAILIEVDQLQGVSTRLDGLAEQYPSVTEALMTVAGSVRKVASVLGVLVAIRSPRPN
jgi:hypothetical protein